MSAGGQSAGRAARRPVAAMKAMRSARRRRYVERADVMEVLYRVYLGAIFARSSSWPSSPARVHEVPADPGRDRRHPRPRPGRDRPRRRARRPRRAALGRAGRAAGDRGGRGPVHAAGAGRSRRRRCARRRCAQLRIAVDRRRRARRRRRQLRLPPLARARRSSGSACLAAFGAAGPALRPRRGAARLGPAPAAGRGEPRSGPLLLAWSALDLLLGANSSPATMLGDLGDAAAAERRRPRSLGAAGRGSPLALPAVGLARHRRALRSRRRGGAPRWPPSCASRPRSRTCARSILLRRQLASERPRGEPWVRLRRAAARRDPVWRRGWQSFLRWPLGADRPRPRARRRRGRRSRPAAWRPHPALRPARRRSSSSPRSTWSSRSPRRSTTRPARTAAARAPPS